MSTLKGGFDVTSCYFIYSRSAAEVDELFERNIKPMNFAKTETATQRLVKAQDNV
jgi:hypothetical protein